MGHPDNDQSSKHIVKQRFNFLVIHDFTLYRLIKANQNQINKKTIASLAPSLYNL